MLQISTYIVVHDQRIVEAFEASGKCRVLGEYYYLFVGTRDVSRVSRLKNLIVARDLPDNIEQHKYLVSLTAWYAVVQNQLCKTPYLAFFDYDNLFSARFLNETLSAIQSYPDALIGYFEGSLSKEGLYLSENHGALTLNVALEQAYSTRLDQLVLDDVNQTKSISWPKCSAFMMSNSNFERYIDWMIPLIPILAKQKDGGHAGERSIKAFAMMNRVEIKYLTGLLEHLQLDSHRTTYAFAGGEQAYEQYFVKQVAYLASTVLP